MTMHIHKGGCHCGNVTYIFESSTRLDELALRICTCSFCRKHGQRSASDPKGNLKVSIKDSSKLNRYRFALNTTDFLICNVCGIYVGAMLKDKDSAWMVTNVNSLEERPALDAPATIHNFDNEDLAGRISRRKTVWTPVVSFTEGA